MARPLRAVIVVLVVTGVAAIGWRFSIEAETDTVPGGNPSVQPFTPDTTPTGRYGGANLDGVIQAEYWLVISQLEARSPSDRTTYCNDFLSFVWPDVYEFYFEPGTDRDSAHIASIDICLPP